MLYYIILYYIISERKENGGGTERRQGRLILYRILYYTISERKGRAILYDSNQAWSLFYTLGVGYDVIKLIIFSVQSNLSYFYYIFTGCRGHIYNIPCIHNKLYPLYLLYFAGCRGLGVEVDDELRFIILYIIIIIII